MQTPQSHCSTSSRMSHMKAQISVLRDFFVQEETFVLLLTRTHSKKSALLPEPLERGLDETYIRVKGEWRYLYRAVDKYGDTIDFLLTEHRDTEAALRFLKKAIRGWLRRETRALLRPNSSMPSPRNPPPGREHSP